MFLFTDSKTRNALSIFVMYERILDLNNLYDAFSKCKKNVDWKHSVQKYEANVLSNINSLRKQLENGTYKQKPFSEFTINERGKTRNIKALHISDRVLQRALCDDILIPELKKYLIYDNGASIKGKGIDFTRKRLKVHLMKYYRKHGNKGYVLKIDFSKYFDSIDHDILIKFLEDKIKDKKVIDLMKYLVGTFGEKGCGIGSQISQVAGIYYLNFLDQFCKTVRQCKYYGRYMDDIYIISDSKIFLKTICTEISYISWLLKLKLNEKKTQIIKLENGFFFLNMKYRISESGKISVIPAKKTITRERRKLKKLAPRLSEKEFTERYKSWRGNISKYNSHNSVLRMDALYKTLKEQHYGKRRIRNEA